MWYLCRMIVFRGLLLFALGGCVAEDAVDAVMETRALEGDRNPFGIAASFHTSGAIDLASPMFLQLGTNARNCATCHAPDMGWALTAKGARKAFERSNGLDYRRVPGAAAARPRGASAVLSRRPGPDDRGGHPVLPEAIRHGIDAPRARGPEVVPGRIVIRPDR